METWAKPVILYNQYTKRKTLAKTLNLKVSVLKEEKKTPSSLGSYTEVDDNRQWPDSRWTVPKSTGLHGGQYIRLQPMWLGPRFSSCWLKDISLGGTWAMELGRHLTLVSLVSSSGKGSPMWQDNKIQMPWSQHLPMHFSFTLITYNLWVHKPPVRGGQKTAWGEPTLSFHVGSRNQTQAIRYPSKCTFGWSWAIFCLGQQSL